MRSRLAAPQGRITVLSAGLVIGLIAHQPHGAEAGTPADAEMPLG